MHDRGITLGDGSRGGQHYIAVLRWTDKKQFYSSLIFNPDKLMKKSCHGGVLCKLVHAFKLLKCLFGINITISISTYF